MRLIRLLLLPFVLALSAWAQGLPAGVTRVAPLAVAEAGGDGRRFELMAAERTGVRFANPYDRPERWRGLWRQYFNGAIGSGIALGDVNGDGLPDLFAVGKDTPNALYMNRGDFRFEDATEAAGVAGGLGMASGAALVDIDNDGDLDLYVCYVGEANELFINNGSAFFREAAGEWGLDYVGGSNAPSFADYDRDGDLDLYLQCNYLESRNSTGGLPDLLFRNEGGRLVDVTAESGIVGDGQGHIALWWDFDDDGWPDVYVANDFEEPDRLYRNNRDGTFANVLGQTLLAAPYSAMGADFGDLDNDGRMELLVAEMSPREREYHQRTVGPLAGKLYNTRSHGVNQYMQNMLSVRVGPSHYAELGFFSGLAATDWSWAPRLVDLDNDGRLDVFMTTGMPRAFHDADIGVKVAQAKSLAARVALFERSPPLRERNLAYRNLGGYRFEEVGAAWGLDHLGVSFAAAMADFDGDGDLDMVVSNWKEGLLLYRNNGVEGSRIALRLRGSRSNAYGLGARIEAESGGLKQVRELSSMRGYMGTDEPVALFSFPEGGMVERIRIDWPSGATQMLEGLAPGFVYEVAEPEVVEPEGREIERTLFVRSEMRIPGETASAEEYFQNFKGQPGLPFVEDRKGPPFLVADFNGDDWLDVALGGATGQALRVFKNVEGRSLEWVGGAVFDRDFESEDAGLAAFDFDGDGYLDLYVSSGGVELEEGDSFYRDRLYRNDGDFAFSRVDLGGEATPSGPVVAGDLNGDGVAELLVAGGTLSRRYPASALNAVAIGGEALAPGFAGSGRTAGMVLADLDGDGDMDLVQAREWAAPWIWWNEGGRLRLDETAVDGGGLSGMWRGLAVADLDGDGRLDIVLGNLGLNTKYAVSRESPGVLLSSDEPEWRRKHIEGVTMGGRLYPLASRLLLQLSFPDLPRLTGTYENWAKLTVEEIFGEEALARFERREFVEARSMVLWQREPGRFVAEALPDLAQVGVATAALAADFDGDGAADIALVLESLSPLPSAAVLSERSFVVILMNDGRGSFECLWPWRSGIDLPTGQARSLAWADLGGDGRGELLVATSEGPLYVFELAAER